jgi:hypothetical protein
MIKRIMRLFALPIRLIGRPFIDMLKKLFTPKGIGTVILFITLIVLILTFQYAYRPYIGIEKTNINYNDNAKDLCVEIWIKNTGNVPASNVHTNTKMERNSIELDHLEGESRFVLFPEQKTTGTPIFHNVTSENLLNDTFEIDIEIIYELPVKFLFFDLSRRFNTQHHLIYEHNSGRFALTSGKYN